MELAQFRIVLVFFVAVLVALPLIQATDVQYCEKDGSHAVAVKNVKISPDPIKRGKKATFSISASTDQAISGGKLVIDVSYFGLSIHQETHDLCEETSCPVSVGDFVIAHSQTLPIFTPPGSYDLKMTMADGDGHQLTCITFGFYIGFFSSESVADN